jgi:hypothetical protein
LSKVEPILGWAALSRAALNRAESELEENAEGMRDEVGVLALHTGYANRFFPGTSVQQTRLKYALFVPWQINELLRAAIPKGVAESALRKSEISLAVRLPNVRGVGNIGRTRAHQQKAVSIPPSESYWVALGAWGILDQHSPAGVAPSRREMFDHWTSWPVPGHVNGSTIDDDKRSIDAVPRLFHPELPDVPAEFSKAPSLDFALSTSERKFLRKRLSETRRPGTSEPSLLARLSAMKVVPGEQDAPWSKFVADYADEADRAALMRAKDAASLSAVVRAIYYAALEDMRDRDGHNSGTKHRDHLSLTVASHGRRARGLRLDDVEGDGVPLGGLKEVLASVQHWLVDGETVPNSAVVQVLREWEQARKGLRARLPKTGDGKDNRWAWSAGRAGTAEPIRYRWALVSRFLHDLAG